MMFHIVVHPTGNIIILGSSCVSQFYLLKLVKGNQRATGMKFSMRVNWRMRSIEFRIKLIVGKIKDTIEMRKDN